MRRAALASNARTFFARRGRRFLIRQQALQLTHQRGFRQASAPEDPSATQPANSLGVVKLIVREGHDQLRYARSQRLGRGACATLMDHRRGALEDFHAKTRLPQRNRRNKPTYTSPNDEDVRLCFHTGHRSIATKPRGLTRRGHLGKPLATDLVTNPSAIARI